MPCPITNITLKYFTMFIRSFFMNKSYEYNKKPLNLPFNQLMSKMYEQYI